MSQLEQVRQYLSRQVIRECPLSYYAHILHHVYKPVSLFWAAYYLTVDANSMEIKFLDRGARQCHACHELDRFEVIMTGVRTFTRFPPL